MTALDSGPCQNWPALCEEWPVGSEAVTGHALQISTEVLWNRTHRRFGLCEMSLRPCRRTCWPQWPWMPPTWYDATGWGWPFPTLIGGRWFNLGCGSCGGECTCTTLEEAVLPGPVADVIEVKVDGSILNPSAYRVDDNRILVRLDGATWPLCNDLNLPNTEVGTWSVTATYGEVLPTLGQLAAGQLALEVAKVCTSASGCLLPASTVKQVTRQGVTKVFFDAETAFKSGKVGLYWPDLFIETYNPNHNNPAVIFDIDGPHHRRINT